MSADEDAHRHADIYRRLDAIEGSVARIHDAYPTDAVVTARLATVQEQVGALRRDLGYLDNRVSGVSGRIDSLREAWQAETSTRRNVWVAAAGTVLAGLVVALLLSGIGALGGG